MKCEICHDKAAEIAIGTDGDGEELYVCKACAEKEQKRRRRRRERTRKSQEASAAHGETSGEGDGVSNLLESMLTSVTNMVDSLNKAIKLHGGEDAPGIVSEDSFFVPLEGVKVAAPYLMRGYLHLEGLFLIGEIAAVRRATEVLGLRLEGINLDGVNEIGHIYRVCHCNNAECATRLVNAIVEQERNARIRLCEELTRVFSDALCRALAILKNCRLLSVGEYFDVLSPLRLAAHEGMLDGIKTREIERIMKNLDLAEPHPFDPPMPVDEREAMDAERADEVNRLFEDVVLNS